LYTRKVEWKVLGYISKKSGDHCSENYALVAFTLL